MLVGTAVSGILFAIFSCQPIILISMTGLTFVFDESLYNVNLMRASGWALFKI